LKKEIPLFWWSESRLMEKEKENYGDLLSKYIIEGISGKKVRWVHPKKQSWFNFNKTHYLAAGSILAHATKNSVVWGSGIIDRASKIAGAKFLAVRGPETRKFLLEQELECPEVYGDPALLISDIFYPKVKKKYKLGIIPHYVDYKEISTQFSNIEGIKIVNLMTHDVESTTREILECQRIISSSLHGLIVPHSYGIPSVWMRFSDKIFGDDVKYSDYYKSVGIKGAKSLKADLNFLDDFVLDSIFSNNVTLPDRSRIDELKLGLIKTFPFVKGDFLLKNQI
jgi:pyruvyltransferase